MFLREGLILFVAFGALTSTGLPAAGGPFDRRSRDRSDGGAGHQLSAPHGFHSGAVASCAHVHPCGVP
jgi:hypothetical protein